MKKLLVMGVALFAAFAFVVPASATDLQLGGYYRVEGRYLSNPQLDEDQDGNDSHWRHRFRITPALIVSDALRFDFKADFFDGTKFGTQGPTAKSSTLFDPDRLWMTIKTGFGSIAVGRMAGGAWGLTFLNDNEDYDRIRFDTKFGNLSTGVILQKNADLDHATPDASDQDLDVYYLYGNYKADIGAFGVLYAYAHNRTNPVVDGFSHSLLPYFDLRFGNFGVRGEAKWGTGENDPDVGPTIDTEELAYMLEADVAFGPFTVAAGYAFVQGENDDPTELTVTNKGYGGIGDDWGLFLVATDVNQVVNTNAFGLLDTGLEMFYVDFAWQATKDWKVWTTAGMFKADEVAAGVDDSVGWEIDLNASWKVMKNLTYVLSGGFFSADDYFESQGIVNVDDTYTLRHQLTLSF